MKILVVSLLRLGDIILTAPILEGLRAKYPDAEIDVLINSQFKTVTKLLPQVHQVYLFERDAMQRGLGEARIPLFEPFDRLDALLDQLSANEYDEVINLTHTRLSGWIMSLIPAKKRIGLVMDANGKGAFGTNWFRFLNHQVDFESTETFHFTDLFRFGLELSGTLEFGLRESFSGQLEAAPFFTGAPVVAIQALTSDTKKDWSRSKWILSLRQFRATHPEVSLVFLGAPNEKERLEPLVRELDAQLAILSLEGAYSFLKRASLLITGDTSIKHLATAAGTPVLEICLGSSDAYRTGAYGHGSLIVQSREACAPCVHSKGCHRDHHACADRIPAEAVALVAGELYSARAFQLKTIAEEYQTEIEILRVENNGGFWAAPSILEPFSEKSIARWLDLACKKIWLSRGAERGTELLHLTKLLKSIHPLTSDIEWRFLLEDFEKQAEFVDSRINSFKVGIEYLKGGYENPKRMNDFVQSFRIFRDRIRSSPLLKSFVSTVDLVIEDEMNPPFTRFRRIVEAVSEMERRTTIYLSLIRGLEIELQIESSTGQGAEKS